MSEKEVIRTRMLDLMEPEDWHKVEETVVKVQQLAKRLTEIEKKIPEEKKITVEKYRELRKQKTYQASIAARFDLTLKELRTWRKEHGLTY